MKKFISFFRQWAGKQPRALIQAEPSDPGPNHHRPSATVLAFQPAGRPGRWPPEALDRLAEDLAATHSAQTNANIIKFPRYRRQYKPEWRPVTRRGS